MTKARTLGNFVSTGNPLSDGTIAASEVTGLATVATSGSYNDLSNKPTITTTATNIAGGSNGTIPYQSAADTTQMLAAGTSGYFLKSNGVAAPSWDAVPATTPAGSSGQLQYNNAGAFAAVSSGTSGQLLTSAGSGAVPTWSTVSAGYTLGTVVSPTSTSVTFTGIPSTAKNIIITFFGINFTSADSFLIRIGGSSGIQTTLYRGGGFASGGGGSFYEDVGFRGYSQYAGANLNYVYQLTLQDPSIGKWVGTGTGGNVGTNNIWSYGGGWKTLNETLTQVQILTRSGSSFDNGSINIAYI